MVKSKDMSYRDEEALLQLVTNDIQDHFSIEARRERISHKLRILQTMDTIDQMSLEELDMILAYATKARDG